MSRRPNIPEEVKREVRQRCGFGCVICGHPIIEYDHIEPYSEVCAHEAINLTCLCPNHHREKTSKRLTKEDIIAANNAPHAKRYKKSRPMHLISNRTPEIKLAGNTFKLLEEMENAAIITIDGKDIFTCSWVDQALLFSIYVEHRNRTSFVCIENNELVHSNDYWDIIWSGPKFTVKDKKRNIFFQLIVNKGLIEIVKMKILRGDEFITVNKKEISLSRVSLHGMQFGIESNKRGAIRIGDETNGRYYFISEPG